MARQPIDAEEPMIVARLRRHAREVFEAGLLAADPRKAVRRALETSTSLAQVQSDPSRRLYLVAFGKAGVSMTSAALEVLSERGLALSGGVAVVNRDNFRALPGVEVFAAGHPLPDNGGARAAIRVELLLSRTRPGDWVLVLVSGGGSALLAAPAQGLGVDGKAQTTRSLLHGAATIREINTVRKHLSRLKGGRLAALAAPAAVEALILSDVVGDDPADVASGPTAPDPTSYEDAYRILERRQLLKRVPAWVVEHLKKGAIGGLEDTPKPNDPIFKQVVNRVIGSNQMSLDAMVQKARGLGYEVEVASRGIVGEAREVGREMCGRLEARGGAPLAVLSGGETTVDVRGPGRGGRNLEMCLSFALASAEIKTRRPWAFLSADTDGRDGSTDAAGAIVDAWTIERATKHRLDAAEELKRNNSYEYLAAAGDLVVTGPTATNVADLQVLLLG